MQLALSAAASLWESGEDAEALKWLRRAANNASDRDADARAVELFKAAAELASELEAAPSSRTDDPSMARTGPFPGATAALAPPQRAAAAAAPLEAPRVPSSGPSSASTASSPRAASTASVPPSARPRTDSTEPTSIAPRPGSRPRSFGSESPIVPAVPPEPAVTEAAPNRVGRRVEETEEDTFIRPETMLRRALMAIDPDYASRTDYTTHEWGERRRRWSSSGALSQADDDAARRPQGSDTDLAPLAGAPRPNTTASAESAAPDPRRRKSSAGARRSSIPSRSSSAGVIPGALPALRVAVLPIPEERDVRLLFLPPGAEAPEGVAVALLVPSSEEDAALLATIYAESDAKL